MRISSSLRAYAIFLANFILCFQQSSGYQILEGSRIVRYKSKHSFSTSEVQQPRENQTVTVNTASELKVALKDSNTRHIIVAKSMNLRWYNGWGGSVSGDTTVQRSTDVMISSAPGAIDRPVVDIGGNHLQVLVSLDTVNLTISRLFLKNVMPTQSETLGPNLSGSRVFLNDSIIHLRGSSELLADTLVQDQENYPEKTAYPPGSCEINGQTVACADGGIMVESSQQMVPWPGNTHQLTGELIISKTLFLFEEYQYRYVANPAILRKYMEERVKEDLFVDPPGKTMDMVKAASCNLESPAYIHQDMMIASNMGASGPTFLEFHQEPECLTLGKGSLLHLNHIIVDECTTQGRFASNFLPFFKMEENTTILLESVVIVVIPKSRSSSLKSIEAEFRSAAVKGDNLMITHVSIEDFYLKTVFIETLFDSPKSPGLLVEDAIIKGESGSKVHLMHSLLILDDSFYSKHGSRLVVTLGSLSACIVVVTILVGFAYWCQCWKQTFPFRTDKGLFASGQNENLLGNIKVDEELTVLSQSPKNHNLHHEHQAVADRLLESLVLGNLIGRGGFGQVYKATWNGAIVAVKVIFHRENVVSADEDVAREASLSSDLRHPNVVQTFMQATRIVTETSDKASSQRSSLVEDAQYVGIRNLHSGSTGLGSAAESNGPEQESPCIQHKETWLVQEFCDLGSLGHSLQLKLLDRGGVVDMHAVLHTCLDISRGMEYLHERNVIHGDLKCTNVLLCSSTQSQRGFVAKVADFGLSRQLAVNATHISTNTIGTLTHMPPELLKGRKLVPKADVYSFGIMMWEILMGKSPFAGWTAPQLLRAVVNDKWRPTFPGHAPRGFNELGMQCLEEEPRGRPEFSEITKKLDQLRVLYAPT